MLLDSSLSIVDDANLVGYEDQSYFTKVFKNITGVSPGKYREKHGKVQYQRGVANLQFPSDIIVIDKYFSMSNH